MQRPKARQKKEKPKKVIGEIGQEVAVREGRIKSSSESDAGPRIVKVPATFYNYWERVKMKSDSRSEVKVDLKRAPISQSDDAQQRQQPHSNVTGSPKTGESKQQHEGHSAGNEAPDAETAKAQGRVTRGTRLRIIRPFMTKPYSRKLRQVKAGRTRKFYMDAPLVEKVFTQKPSIGKNTPLVKNIFTQKPSIRKMPDDDPRIAARMPGPRYTRDPMDGLIRVKGTDPPTTVPEKAFTSIFYKDWDDRDSKEDKAIDVLLNDLASAGNEQSQDPDPDTGPPAPQPTRDTQEKETDDRFFNKAPKQASKPKTGRNRRTANRLTRRKQEAAAGEGAKLATNLEQQEPSGEEDSIKPGVKSSEDFFRSFER